MALEPISLSEARAAIIPAKRMMTPTNNPTLLTGYGSYGGFAAAPIGRTNQEWIAFSRTADQNLVVDLRRLRNRARERAINSPIAAKFLSIIRTQVVGAHGIRVEYKVPKLRAREDGELLDDVINGKLLTAWEQWCHRGVCTVDGKRALRDVLLLAMDCLGRDGECFIRRRYVAKSASNPFGFALQMIDADQVDESYNTAPGINGVQVRLGVEVDSDMRPIAYHVFSGFPSETGGQKRRVRIPAEEIYHLYSPRFVSQTRGYPLMAPALYDMHQLDDYFKAELTAARWGAKMIGAIESTGDVQYMGDTGKPPGGASPVQVGDATLFNMPINTKLNNVTPEHPTAAFSSFTERSLRFIASALNVPYHELGNDYASVNFSSGRLSVNESRDFYTELQAMLIDTLVQPIHDDWIKAALLNNAIDLPFDPGRYTNSSAREFIPRAWHGIQPFEEAKTAILEMQNGLTTKAEVMHGKGKDWRKTLKQLAVESEYEESLGLKLGTDVSGKSTTEVDNEEPPPESGGAGAPPK